MAKAQKRSTIVKKLDTIFSQFIRLRNADVNGNVQCVTCGKQDHWKKMQAGHFASRKHYSTRWDEINVQVQCVGCNVYRYGEQFKFSKWIDANYYKGMAEEIMLQANQVIKYSNQELLEMVNYFKVKVEKFNM